MKILWPHILKGLGLFLSLPLLPLLAETKSNPLVKETLERRVAFCQLALSQLGERPEDGKPLDPIMADWLVDNFPSLRTRAKAGDVEPKELLDLALTPWSAHPTLKVLTATDPLPGLEWAERVGSIPLSFMVDPRADLLAAEKSLDEILESLKPLLHLTNENRSMDEASSFVGLSVLKLGRLNSRKERQAHILLAMAVDSLGQPGLDALIHKFKMSQLQENEEELQLALSLLYFVALVRPDHVLKLRSHLVDLLAREKPDPLTDQFILMILLRLNISYALFQGSEHTENLDTPFGPIEPFLREILVEYRKEQSDLDLNQTWGRRILGVHVLAGILYEKIVLRELEVNPEAKRDFRELADDLQFGNFVEGTYSDGTNTYTASEYLMKYVTPRIDAMIERDMVIQHVITGTQGVELLNNEPSSDVTKY